jgi:hypothetical protein
MELHLLHAGPEENASQILDPNMQEFSLFICFYLLCLPNIGCFWPLLQVLKEPVCAGALRPQPEARPGASTDNLVWGRFNGLSEVGVVLASKNLWKPNSRVKISNSSFYIRWMLQYQAR